MKSNCQNANELFWKTSQEIWIWMVYGTCANDTVISLTCIGQAAKILHSLNLNCQRKFWRSYRIKETPEFFLYDKNSSKYIFVKKNQHKYLFTEKQKTCCAVSRTIIQLWISTLNMLETEKEIDGQHKNMIFSISQHWSRIVNQYEMFLNWTKGAVNI